MIIKQYYWLPAVLLFVLGVCGQRVMATPVAWEQPQQQWLSQQSQHFTVSFLNGHQHSAARALDIAEQVHSELLPFFKGSPQQRTELVLVDDYDFSNGWASSQPFAQIRLYIAPPEDVSGLEVYDEWLHTLIRHEYVHIMHMELADGAVSALRKIFGRNLFLFPHALTPGLLLEGLAVYLESNKELGYGRLQGSYYEMQMRMQVAAGEVKDLQQVAVASRQWPLNSPYLYGAYFIEYLAATYGEEKLQLFLQRYSRQVLPYFLLNHSAKEVFGKDFISQWGDYQDYLSARFSKQITELKQSAVSGHELYKSLFLQVTASSSRGLLVNRHNGEDRANIAVLSAEQGQTPRWQHIVNSKGVTALAEHDTAGLAVSRQVDYADGRTINDLFVYQHHQWRALSSGQRFRKLRWMPSGKQLLASRKVAGLSELWLLGVQQGAAHKRIWQGERGVVLGGFDISADGDYLIAALKRPQQGWNLERLALASSTENYLQWQAVSNTKAVENSPVYLPDGRIAFSADYQGVYNIFVLDPQSQRVTQWTREVGGAFLPHWQQGLGLVYQAYTGNGYSVRHIEQPQSLASFALDSVQGNYDYPDPVLEKSAKSKIEKYSPWPTLAPRTWLPLWEFDNLVSRAGMSFYGADALGRHNYQLAADWDFNNQFANYNLNYQYDNRWLVSALREHNFQQLSLSGQRGYFISQDDLLSVQRRNLWPLWEDQLRLHSAMVLDKTRLLAQPAFINQGQYQSSNETLLGLALTFDNRQWYLNVPGVGWGTYMDLLVETNTPFNSDYSGQKYQGQWSMTLDLSGRSTLTARLAAGYADSDAKAFSLGGHDLSEEMLLFARDRQGLRGYDAGVQVGHRYATQRLQFNTWLGRVERNWSLLPLGLGDISGALFVDSGAAWNGGAQRKQLTGIGSELTAGLKLGYKLSLPVTFGVAKGLDNESGGYQGYLRMQMPF